MSNGLAHNEVFLCGTAKVPVITAREGAVYLYRGTTPPKCRGHRYRILFFVLDVPSYQQKVCMEALTGPDKGLRFVCSEANFGDRYQEAPEPEVVVDSVPPLEKTAGHVPEAWRSGV
jgi:phosphatidylethanolamine-binding protein (PEBP) family uncharacterized protein